MRRLWLLVGNVIAYCGWPVLFFYLRIGKRTRVVLVADESVLVVRGWLGSAKWSLPGGGLHKNEEPAAGGCRELYEETGLSVVPDKMKLVGEFKAGKRGLRFSYYGFICHLDQKINPTLKGLEIVEAKWVPLVELNNTNTYAEVLNVLSKI